MMKRRPLEATLMIQFDLDLHEARELVSIGCENLGLSADANVRQDELRAECLRLVKGNKRRETTEVHFNPSDSAPLRYTEIYFDPAQSMPSLTTRATAPSRSKSMVPTSVTPSTPRQKKEDDYDFCKKDYNHLYPSDDDDDSVKLRRSMEQATPYSTPRQKKSPLSNLSRRRGEGKKSGSVDSDDLSFLVDPLDQDESIQDSKTSQKDVAGYFASLDIRLETPPQRSPKLVDKPKLTSSRAPVAKARPEFTSKPITASKPHVPVPAALAGYHKSPNSCNKTSDATNVTEASTVDSGIPSVIYCIHRDDDDDDDIGSLGSPIKSPIRESKEMKKSLLSRFSNVKSPASSSRQRVTRSKSGISKRDRENFERLYVDL